MEFILLPLTGAAIGWITNVLAIRLLFKPFAPIKLGPLFLQGLIPKRRGEIARQVGQVVARQLLSVDELTMRLDLPALQRDAEKIVRQAVENWCAGRMGVLPQALRYYLCNLLMKKAEDEVAQRFPAMAKAIVCRLREQVQVENIVAEKINSLSLAEVEGMVLKVAFRELKHIEALGAVLGLFIGLAQAVLIRFFH